MIKFYSEVNNMRLIQLSRIKTKNVYHVKLNSICIKEFIRKTNKKPRNDDNALSLSIRALLRHDKSP